MKQQVAVYLRLSQEDLDKRTCRTKDESNSISAQRLLIARHLDEDPALRDLPRLEFCDDGCTGTSFDRPAFSRMIGLVRRGEISCIAVKDLSRFGRDYLEVGDYLEHIFPFLGVRFMAVNDHYDSSRHAGQTIGMDVAFRNLIYDCYSKDLSQKVRSAMGMKQKEARYVSCPPFGYRTSPATKHQLEIDPAAAPVVRRIFLEFLAGNSTTQIALGLNRDKIATPAEHKASRVRADSPRPQWTHYTVLNILKNLKYTGTMVNHTRESRRIQDSGQRRVPREEWYLRENAHEAIVSREEFERAQAAIGHRRKAPRAQHSRSDRVYVCGHCGRKLEKANGTVFSCPSHRYHAQSPCEAVRWRKDSLEQVLLEALKAQIALAEASPPAASAGRDENRLRRRIAALQAQYDACGREKLARYEAYREGRITDEDFLCARGQLTQQQRQWKEQIAALERRREARQEMEAAGEMRRSAGSMAGWTEEQLREHLYDAVEQVLVYGPGGIEIVWRFQDAIGAAAEKSV